MLTFNILEESKPGFCTWILINKTDTFDKRTVIAYRRCIKFMARQLKLPLNSFSLLPRSKSNQQPMHISIRKEDCEERSIDWRKLPVVAETFIRGFLAGYREKKTKKRIVVLNGVRVGSKNCKY